MKHALSVVGILAVSALTACKPPPTDADMVRDTPEAQPTFASEPLPSPQTEGAEWAPSSRVEKRLIYGIPGEPALVALECADTSGTVQALRITRLSPADQNASALLAIIGNGHIGRIAVEAREMDGRVVWQGENAATDRAWEPLTGPRQMTLTVPGAGMVTLNPSEMPGELLETCRFDPEASSAP